MSDEERGINQACVKSSRSHLKPSKMKDRERRKRYKERSTKPMEVEVDVWYVQQFGAHTLQQFSSHCERAEALQLLTQTLLACSADCSDEPYGCKEAD